MFKVLASLRSDMNEGWVWISDRGFPPRSIIKIRNPAKRAAVYCEALNIDENFRSEYNQAPRVNIGASESTIVINGWYRKKLGDLQTKSQHNLEITVSNGLWGKFMACMQHPQIVVRLATTLAIISVALGILGVILSCM